MCVRMPKVNMSACGHIVVASSSAESTEREHRPVSAVTASCSGEELSIIIIMMMKFIRHSGSTDSIVIYRQANRLTDRYKYNKTDTMKTKIKAIKKIKKKIKIKYNTIKKKIKTRI